MMVRASVAPTDQVAVNAVLFAVRQAADVICDRASLSLIVAALSGYRRFGDLVETTGLPTRVVIARLRTLESLGLFVRMPYSLRPLRHEYVPSIMGEAFSGIIFQLIRWERQWSSGAQQRSLVHLECGAALILQLRCAGCAMCAAVGDMDIKVSLTRLRTIPAKQTLHRRSGRTSAIHGHEEQLLAESFDIIGDKWTVEIIMCAFFRIRRFGDFRAAMGIAPNILADRLERLLRAGVFQKAARTPGAVSNEYRLTAKGVDLFGVLIALQDWADCWVRARTPSPVRIIHRHCGENFHAAAACAACGRMIGRLADLNLTQGGIALASEGRMRQSKGTTP